MKYSRKTKILIFIFIITLSFFCGMEFNDCSKIIANNETVGKEVFSDKLTPSFKHHLKTFNMSINLKYINVSEEEEEVEEEISSPYDNYEFVEGWTIDYTNIRIEPNLNSDIIEVLSYNNPIEYAQHDEEWSVIKYKDDYAFVQTKYISNEKCNYEIVNVPAYDKYEGFKTWMPYTAISCVESPQYKLQQIAYTSTYGIRMYDERYCIAVGTAITSDVGVYIDVILENGTVIPCIVGDIKADIHTNDDNIFTLHSNCCTEFIVDMDYLDAYVKLTGNVSKACAEWDSKVVKFKVYNDVDIVDW